MKKALLFILLLACVLVAQAPETNGHKENKVKCVISGEDIDKAEYASYKDGKVYFCCGGCKMDFEDSSAKFSTAANFQLAATGQYTQTSCPFTGRKMKASKALDVNGTTVTLCSNRCYKKAKKSKEKVSLLFSDKSFDKGFESNQKKTAKKKS